MYWLMSFLRLFVFIVLGLKFTCSQHKNNVCRSIEDYFNDMANNNNCWYDSDLKAEPEQIATNHGYLLEKHLITTDDKYVLTTFRVKSTSGLYGNEVIYLQHGLAMDAQCYMGNGNKSTAFFLFEQGYDVWVGNYRGSKFSKHSSLSRNDRQFWDFRFHEHGIYDLAANIKYVAVKTEKKITYIGHSMGGSGFGIYASINPNEAQQFIKHAILLAPAFYLKNTKGLVNANNVFSYYHVMNMIDNVIPINVIRETNSFIKKAVDFLCFLSLESTQLCVKFLEGLFGKAEIPIIDPERLPFFIDIFRNIGLKDTFHLAQIIESNGEFVMYDYGAEENLERYKSFSPPPYNLSKITVPVTLFYGEHDNIVTKSDIIYAATMFQKPDTYGLPYGHALFLFDKNADKIAYPTLLKALNKFKS